MDLPEKFVGPTPVLDKHNYVNIDVKQQGKVADIWDYVCTARLPDLISLLNWRHGTKVITPGAVCQITD